MSSIENEQQTWKLEPIDDTLRAQRDRYHNTIQFVTLGRDVFNPEGEHIDPNYMQLDRLLRMIALQDGSDAKQTYQDMMHGATIAYNVLLETAAEGEDVRTKLYSALGSLQTQAMNEADKKETNRPGAIGVALNDIIDDNIIFDSVDSSEGQFVFDMMSDLRKDGAGQYDALRGYRLVRLAIPWAEHRREYVVRKVLDMQTRRYPIKAPIEPKLIESINMPQKEEFEADFLEAIEGLEFDPHTLEGLEDCEKDIATLLTGHQTSLSYMSQSDISKSELFDDTTEALQESVLTHFMELPTLKLRDNISIIGNTSILVCDANGVAKTIYVISDQWTVQGILTEPSIMSVATQTYIDAIVSGDDKLSKKASKEKPNLYGLTLLVDNISVTKIDGTSLTIDAEDSAYVCIEHKGVKVYRDPLAPTVD